MDVRGAERWSDQLTRGGYVTVWICILYEDLFTKYAAIVTQHVCWLNDILCIAIQII